MPLVARYFSTAVFAHVIERLGQVDGDRRRCQQDVVGPIERFVGSISRDRQAYAIGGGCTDQRRVAHLHGLDCVVGLIERAQSDDGELMRQQGLMDDFDRRAIGRDPDRAVRFANNALLALLTARRFKFRELNDDNH